MRNNINVLVVCSKNESVKLNEEISKRSTEINVKYSSDNYKEALAIINNPSSKIDAVIVDATLNNENILDFLMKYENDILISKTIIIDNIKLDCYNLSNSKYQIFNILPKEYKIDELLLSLVEIKNKNEKYNLDDAINILSSKEFFEYVMQVGISVSGKSKRITSKDINNFRFKEMWINGTIKIHYWRQDNSLFIRN